MSKSKTGNAASVSKDGTHDKIVLNTQRFFCYLVLILLTLLCLFSFYVLVINTTRSHPDIQKGFSFLPGKSFIANVKSLLGNEQLPVLSGMMNSLIVSTCSALLCVYFSAMTAYAIHAYEFKLRKFAFTFILLIMMVPTQVSTLGFLQLITKLGIMNSYIPLIIPAIAAPVVFFYMYQSMEATLPYSIVEAARVDGSNEFYTFNAIVCPMLKPAFAVQSIFAFVSSWNNYFVPALVISDKKLWTVPIVIANARSADYMMFDLGDNYTLMTVAILPLIVIYFLLSRYIIGGVTAGGVKE